MILHILHNTVPVTMSVTSEGTTLLQCQAIAVIREMLEHKIASMLASSVQLKVLAGK